MRCRGEGWDAEVEDVMVGEYGVVAIVIASRHSCCTIGRGFKERMPELRIE